MSNSLKVYRQQVGIDNGRAKARAVQLGVVSHSVDTDTVTIINNAHGTAVYIYPCGSQRRVYPYI